LISAFVANLVMREEVAIANTTTVHQPKPKNFQHYGIIMHIVLVQSFFIYYVLLSN
jgi:hypothetical protein